MSLPPLNPDRTAAGIIVDPKTLERVVPSSRRKDGTVRKELKIRPGFTPQEDVGRFKGTRQAQADALKGYVPGSNRPPQPRSTTNPDNPFAQPPASAPEKTKAQLKNEKRRAAKRTAEGGASTGVGASMSIESGSGTGSGSAGKKVSKKDTKETSDWDEMGSSDEDGAEDLEKQFKNLSTGTSEEKSAGAGTEESFPPIGGNASAPLPSIHTLENESENTLSGISKESPNDKAIAAVPPTLSSSTTDTSPSTTRAAEGTERNKVAPPDVPEGAAGMPPSKKVENAWRASKSSQPKSPSQKHNQTQPASTSNSNSKGKNIPGSGSESGSGSEPKAPGKPHAIQGGRQGPLGLANPPKERDGNKGKSKSGGGTAGTGKPGVQEPRVRKEIRVRQGGVNDASSLAARLKGLVQANTESNNAGRSPQRREKSNGSA